MCAAVFVIGPHPSTLCVGTSDVSTFDIKGRGGGGEKNKNVEKYHRVYDFRPLLSTREELQLSKSSDILFNHIAV